MCEQRLRKVRETLMHSVENTIVILRPQVLSILALLRSDAMQHPATDFRPGARFSPRNARVRPLTEVMYLSFTFGISTTAYLTVN